MTEVGAVPAWTPLVLVGTANATYNVPVISEAYAPATNLLRIGDECTVFSGTTYDYILYTDNKFHPVSGTVAINKAYLHLDSNPNPSGAADGLRIVFEENNTTGLDAVNSPDKAGYGEADCPSGKKFFENGQLRILRNNTVYDVLGRIVK